MSAPLRFITVDIVLHALAVAVEQGKTKLSPAFTAKYLDGYRNALQSVKALCKNEELAPQLYDMFKEQWAFIQQYRGMRKKRHSQVLNDASLMFGVYNDPKLRMSELLRFATGDKDLAQQTIRVFLLMRQMLAVLNETENVEDVDTFPFKEEEETEPPKSDTFILSDASRVISSQQFEGQLLLDRYIVEDDKAFIMLEPDYNQLAVAKVLLHTKITNVRCKIDVNDPKKLTVTILKGKEGEETEEKTLFFDAHTMALYVKNRIEESHKGAVQRQIAMVATFLDSCELHHSRIDA